MELRFASPGTLDHDFPYLRMHRRPHAIFLSYNGLLEPLGQTQALAYVEELSSDYEFTIVSFEKLGGTEEEAARISALEKRLRQSGIRWRRMRYHKRPSLPATAFDIAMGARAAAQIVRREGAQLLHARGYVPAAMAWLVRRMCGVPYIFDIRGLMAEEYVDGGIWQPGSLPVRITKRMERALLRDAAGLVTLTDAIRPHVEMLRQAAGAPAVPWEVIPCCVDLDRFRPDAAARQRIRTELGLEDRPLMVYAGSVGTWYLVDEMLRYFRATRADVPDLALLLLVNSNPAEIEPSLRACGIQESDVRVVRAGPEAVPAYLAAADIGISFIRPCLSKLASSPTKIGEYLASGLPLVLNRGIGDSDQLAETGVASVVDLGAEDVPHDGRRIAELLDQTGEAPRRVAEERFSVSTVAGARYRRLYRAVLDDRPSNSYVSKLALHETSAFGSRLPTRNSR